MTTARFLKAAALHRQCEPIGPDLSKLTPRERRILFAKYWGLWVPTPGGYRPARELSERDWEVVDFDYVPPREPEPAPAPDAAQAGQEATPVPPPPAAPPAPPPPPPAPEVPKPWYEEYVRWRERTTAEDFYFLYAADDDEDDGY